MEKESRMSLERVSRAIVAVLCVLFLSGCAGQAWDEATRSNTVAGYRTFLTEYGDSEYAPKASQRIEGLRWDEWNAKGDTPAYNAYLEAYPEGAHAEQARAKLEALARKRESLAFERAKKSDTLDAYDAFMEEYPDSGKVADAKQFRAAKALQRFTKAIEAADVAEAKAMLAEGIDAKSTMIDGDPALFAAVKKESLELVETLLAAGAPAHVLDKGKRTPLDRALWAGQEKIARALIAAGAEVDYANETGETPLSGAACECSIELVRDLLERGVEIEAHGDSGWTALAGAAARGRLEIVKLLLDRGANPDLSLKANYGNRRTLLEVVAKAKHEDVLAELKKHSLLNAASEGDVERLRRLMKLGRDVNATSGDGSPLYLAAEGGHVEAVRLLLEAGADDTMQTKVGRDKELTPLQAAVRGGHAPAVRLLLRKDTDIRTLAEPCVCERSGLMMDNVMTALRRFSGESQFEMNGETAAARFVVTPAKGATITNVTTAEERIQASRSNIRLMSGSTATLTRSHTPPKDLDITLKASGPVQVRGLLVCRHGEEIAVVSLDEIVFPEGKRELLGCWMVSKDVSLGQTTDEEALKQCRRQMAAATPEAEDSPLAVFKLNADLSLSLLP
jgi:ankyrin repeat protein